MIKICSLLAALVAITAATQAEAACAVTGRTISPVVSLTYNPFAPSSEIADINVEITNTGNAACTVRLFARPSTGGSSLISGSDRLLYRFDNGGGAGGGGEAGEIGPFSLTVGAGQQRMIGIHVVIPAQQIVPRGLYKTDLALRLVGHAEGPLTLTGGIASLNVAVPARIEMNISGAAAGGNTGPLSMAPASINFGEAHGGQTERVFVNIWSNGSVNVAMSSENGGVLRHMENAALPPISYSARFDGQQVDMRAPVLLTRSPPATLSGGAYELALTLGDIKHNYAGQYKDVITVSISEN
ncbi:hypothetical protein G4G27_02320 [Sphingomonas sp. So64.6b]|uniref:hypothetical protein n=1 Tax=Sphingomonas sp. So64.6b TaxID=2997354 RepID=UPI0016018AA4|nr:hypothetical protein [Sphingomonas sp. So64.6b]QNA82978.1 hypothetical protein G4G27_02320 [Sphingomonas sp. So64.6b]